MIISLLNFYRFILIISMINLISCNGFGPIDKSIIKEIPKEPNQKEPNQKDLIGKWEVDSFSYNLVKEQYNLNNNKIELIFQKDGNFKAINFRDFVANGFGKSINGRLLNSTGKWLITPENNTWSLKMEFEKGKLYITGINTTYFLYYLKSELVIMTFIGDPDQADRLLFRKK